MADQQSDLVIVVEAINKASKILQEMEGDLQGLSKSVEEQGGQAEKAAMGFGELVIAVATGHIAARLAIGAFEKLGQVLFSLPGMLFDIAHGASEIEGMGIAMHVVANNAGITADAVDEVRDSVVEQNVTTQAANRLLTDLIRNQLDYTQATELATAAQNIAVASGRDSSEVIERISTSIASGNTWLLRQLGLVEHLDSVYERYGETLGKTSEELTESERKQAVVNYVLEEGEKYAGAYGAAMANAAKAMRSTQAKTKELSYSLGKVFGPALNEMAQEVLKFAKSLVEWAQENEGRLKAIAKQVGEFVKRVVSAVKAFISSIPWDFVISAMTHIGKTVINFGNSLKVVYNVIQIFVRAILETVESVKTLGKALSALIRGDFEDLKSVYTEWREYQAQTTGAILGDLGDIGDAFRSSYDMQAFDLKEWWNSIEEIEGSGWINRLSELDENLNQMTSKQREALKKMTEDLIKENAKYQREVTKRAKQFEESFDDLVITHRDAIEELTADLTEETENYNDKIDDLLIAYIEAIEQMEERHGKKTEKIMADMEAERKKTEEELDKITKKYNEETTLIEREGEARLSNLKAQRDREKALGDNSDKEKLAALDKMIAYEEKGLKGSLGEKKDKYDEEVSKVEDTLSSKLTELQKGLDEEDRLYDESFEKRKRKYEEDAASAAKSYEKKRGKLQEELDKELAIREKYAEDFKRIGNKIAEDDLTRLTRKHEEELVELLRAHNEQVAEIEKRGFDAGVGFTEGFADGFDTGYPEVKNKLNQMGADIDRVTNKFGNLGQMGGLGDYYTPATLPGTSPLFGQYGGVFSKPTIVGEAGAELVLPLNFPKKMAALMQSSGISQGGGGGEVTQNFYVTVKSSQDVDVLMERAGFALRQGGGSG